MRDLFVNIRDSNFVFFGTRELGAIVLKHLLSRGYSPSLVVTSPDKPTGRKQDLTPSPVKRMAEAQNLPLVQPAHPSEILSRPELKEAEFIVLAAYGKILPKELVDLPPKGALNVHPSLLPKYRGPSPERSTLLNGEKKTGVTIIRMDEEVDHGPVLAQREFVVPEGMKHEELHCALAELGGELLAEIIPQWLEGKITPKEQDHSRATYTKKLTKEGGRIDWKKPAEYIERQVRAFYPWPGTFTTFQGKRLKILKASVLPSSVTSEGKLTVQTGKGTLFIEELQLEGGKPMNSQEFLLGHKHVELL